VTAQRTRARGDDGAVLVEFALIVPILFLIVFGIIEFGWGFAQYLDVRHGTREGARLAAVNYTNPDISPPSSGATQSQEILTEVCSRIGDTAGVTVTLSFDDAAETDLGDRASIALTSQFDTLTGFLDAFLEGADINDTVSFRLERDATWTEDSLTCS
jgi:Flp pilus assembly protein TadG